MNLRGVSALAVRLVAAVVNWSRSYLCVDIEVSFEGEKKVNIIYRLHG